MGLTHSYALSLVRFGWKDWMGLVLVGLKKKMGLVGVGLSKYLCGFGWVMVQFLNHPQVYVHTSCQRINVIRTSLDLHRLGNSGE
jgi:hypothetical protein